MTDPQPLPRSADDLRAYARACEERAAECVHYAATFSTASVKSSYAHEGLLNLEMANRARDRAHQIEQWNLAPKFGTMPL